VPGVVQGLVRHATGKTAVADNGHHVIVVTGKVAGQGHTQGRRYGGAAVAGIEDVVRALISIGKTRQAPVPAQGGKTLFSPGEQLVHIALVPHIPDYPVPGAVEHAVQGNAELNHTQVGGQVAPVHSHPAHQQLPDLGAKLLQGGMVKRLEVGRAVDIVQYPAHRLLMLAHGTHAAQHPPLSQAWSSASTPGRRTVIGTPPVYTASVNGGIGICLISE